MKIKAFTLAIALNLLAVAPMWTEQKAPEENLLPQLENRLAKSVSKAKLLTGKPKSL